MQRPIRDELHAQQRDGLPMMRLLICCVCTRRIEPGDGGAPAHADVLAHERCVRLR